MALLKSESKKLKMITKIGLLHLCLKDIMVLVRNKVMLIIMKSYNLNQKNIKRCLKSSDNLNQKNIKYIFISNEDEGWGRGDFFFRARGMAGVGVIFGRRKGKRGVEAGAGNFPGRKQGFIFYWVEKIFPLFDEYCKRKKMLCRNNTIFYILGI